MLQCGQLFLYGIHGVCQIVDVEVRVIDRKKIEYYVLEPVSHPSARFYVPVHNQVALSKLHPLLSKEELCALISSCDANRDSWIPDEGQRKNRYRELINGSDRAALLAMVRSVWVQKDLQLTSGKKFHQCDENFLRDAQKVLGSELSLVLGIAFDKVFEYIQNNT